MDRANVEEKIKALEAALELAEKRNLPAVPEQNTALRDVSAEEKARGVRDSLAAFLLEKMETRVSRLEESESLQTNQQAIFEAMHREEREAIEIIGNEVAALKQKTASMEQWLEHMERKPHDTTSYQPPHYPSAASGKRNFETVLIVIMLAAVCVIALAVMLFRSF